MKRVRSVRESESSYIFILFDLLWKVLLLLSKCPIRRKKNWEISVISSKWKKYYFSIKLNISLKAFHFTNFANVLYVVVNIIMHNLHKQLNVLNLLQFSEKYCQKLLHEIASVDWNLHLLLNKEPFVWE